MRSKKGVDSMEMINIGLGSFVSSSKIMAVINPESAPVKRMVSDAKDNGTIVDATYGRRTRSVLVMENGYLVLSSLQPATLISKK